MPYITSADVILRYDRRRVADLLSDIDGSPVEPADLPGSASLSAIILDACAEIDAAVTVGNKYTKDELATLAADGDGGYLLKRLACDIVWASLLAFKGLGDADLQVQAPRFAESKRLLASLYNGDMVFGIAGARNAGLPKVVIPNKSLTNAPTLWNQMFGVFGSNNQGC